MSEELSAWEDFLKAMLGDLAEPMTYQQAAMDAAADYRTEQQQNRIERCASN